MTGMSFVIMQQAPWKAPATADKLTNPFKGDSLAADAGGKIFLAQCIACHGKMGTGDGVAGSNLSPRPANLQSERVKSQTDGAIYWKITTGRAPMPSFSGLGEKQCWQLVCYVRRLQAGKVSPKKGPQSRKMMMHNGGMMGGGMMH